MSFVLGVDLGTTYTAAAVCRAGTSSIVELGDRSSVVPSILFLREDGELLVGDAARRRALDQPARLAREFKRRFGDTVPLLLGGSPLSAQALTGGLLGWVIERVTEREGGRPDALVVTHPANWGPFRVELLEQVVGATGITPFRLLTEPVAAVRHYSTLDRLAAGDTVAVYDLGGGTFDAAVVRQTAGGLQLLGEPQGVENLGGIDFDEAVFGHVGRAIELDRLDLDLDDPVVLASLSRLRVDCTEGKEVLSSDTDVDIPVQLPGLTSRIRLTRAELEDMIRPAVTLTVDALVRAVEQAGVAPSDLRTVLLVGGSSRIPLIGAMVKERLGCPVAVDVHPKHPVALGAAAEAETLLASAPSTAAPAPTAGAQPGSDDDLSTARPVVPFPVQPDPVTSDVPAAPSPAAGGGPEATGDGPVDTPSSRVSSSFSRSTLRGRNRPAPSDPPPQPAAPPTPPAPPAPQPVASAAPPNPSGRETIAPTRGVPDPPPAAPAGASTTAGPGTTGPPPVTSVPPTGGGSSKWPKIAAAAAAALAVIALVAYLIGRGGESDSSKGQASSSSSPSSSGTGATNGSSASTTPPNPDAAIDSRLGAGTGAFQRALATPVVASGEPLVVAFQTTQIRQADQLKAAADFINSKLGGFGGRPIKVESCEITEVTPAASSACTAKLLASKPFIAMQGVNYDAPRSIEEFRAGGVVLNVDAIFHYPAYSSGLPILYLQTASCAALGAAMVDKAVNGYGARKIYVPYQPRDGCYVNALDTERAQSGIIPNGQTYPDGLRLALDKVAAKATHQAAPVDLKLVYGSDADKAGLGARLDALAGEILGGGFDAILIKYEEVCPELVRRLQAKGWDSTKVHLITTGCGNLSALGNVTMDVVGPGFTGPGQVASADPITKAEIDLGRSLSGGDDFRLVAAMMFVWQAYGDALNANGGSGPPTGDQLLAVARSGRRHFFGGPPADCGHLQGFPSLCVSSAQQATWRNGAFEPAVLDDFAARIFGVTR